ncbi:MAG: hypothetical protein ACP6IY_11095 [Promethearchaeia archaeon]
MVKRKIKVAEKTGGYVRIVNGKKQYVKPYIREVEVGNKYNEIEEEFAKDLFIKRIQRTHPDVVNNANKMFWKPNEYWKNHMDTTDLLGVDGTKPPVVSNEPDYGMPYEVVQYKGKIYIADETGFFMEKDFYEKLTKMTKKEIAKRLGIRNSLYPKEEYIRIAYAAYKNNTFFLNNILKKAKSKSNPVANKQQTQQNKGLYNQAKYQKYSQIVKIDTPENAEKSTKILFDEFENAKTNKKRLRIWRITRMTARRCRALAERKDLSDKERRECKKIAEKYEKSAEVMHKKYRYYREIERAQNEIEMLEYHRKNPENTPERNRELDSMIAARKQFIKQELSKNI